MNTGTARVNDTSIYYEILGDGPALVLVSGGGTLDRRAWDDQFEAFAASHRVVRYDVRGIGRSWRPVAPFSHSDDLRALLKALDIQNSSIAGVSFGGTVALDFALDYPEMVDALILAASGTSSDAKASLRDVGSLAALARAKGVAHVFDLILGTPTFVSRENTTARSRIREIYDDNRDVFESGFPIFDYWEPTDPPAAARLSEVRARTLVVVGELDAPANIAMCERVATGIPEAVWKVVPDAAHLVNLENPAEFNRAVLEFLAS
jgi:pimeloyl-ACP methyl ester carboxylesterase